VNCEKDDDLRGRLCRFRRPHWITGQLIEAGSIGMIIDTGELYLSNSKGKKTEIRVVDVLCGSRLIYDCLHPIYVHSKLEFL
jgi:hypothetical protein